MSTVERSDPTDDLGDGIAGPHSFANKLAALRNAFPPDLVKWRLMRRPRDGDPRAQAVAYLSMDSVEEFLDEVLGSEGWRSSYPIVGQFVVCRIELRTDEGEWIGKEDGCGDNVDREAQNASEDDLDKDTKAVLSDAFKRAARRWGVGRYLFRIGKPWVDCKPVGRSYMIADHELPRLAELVRTGVDPQQNGYRQPAQSHQRPPQQQAQQQRQAHPPQQQAQQQRRQATPPPLPEDDIPFGGHDDCEPPPQGEYDDYDAGERAPTTPRNGGNGSAPAGKVFTIPMGRSKGTPLSEATEEDIRYVIGRKQEETNPKFARSNQEWIAAANAELTRRAPAGDNTSHGQRSDRRPPPPPRGSGSPRRPNP